MKTKAALGIVASAVALAFTAIKPSQAATFYSYSLDRDSVIFTSDTQNLAFEFDISLFDSPELSDIIGEVKERSRDTSDVGKFTSLYAKNFSVGFYFTRKVLSEFEMKVIDPHKFLEILGFPVGKSKSYHDQKFAVEVGIKKMGGTDEKYGINAPLDFVAEVPYPVRRFNLFFPNLPPNPELVPPIGLTFVTTLGELSIYPQSYLPPRVPTPNDPEPPKDPESPGDDEEMDDSKNSKPKVQDIPEPNLLLTIITFGLASFWLKKHS